MKILVSIAAIPAASGFLLPLVLCTAASGAVQLNISQVDNQDPAKEPTVAVKADGNRVLVMVLSASYNCCYIADARLEVEGGRVEIRERNAGTECESLVPCYFDMTYTVSRLLPGKYEVSLFAEHGMLVVKDTVEVAAIVTQAECTQDPPEKEKVVASATADSIVVEHRSAFVQCCLEFAPKVEIDGDRIRITALDVSPVPCNCVCYFNLAVEIPGLAPGDHHVEYIGFDGVPALDTDLRIASPRMVVTQARIGGRPAIPEKRTSIFVEGDDVVVEYVAIVEQCCLDLDAWAEIVADQDPTALNIRVQDNGPPCDCISPYLLRFEVLDLPAGSYRVTCAAREVATGDVVITQEEIFFVRGFVSADDWDMTITDAIQILGHLFLGSPEALPCRDSADSNDDGEVNLSDAVHLLGYLFLGGPAPPPPFPRPGLDPTADDLGCEGVPCDSSKLVYETQPGAPWDFVEFCIPQGKPYEDEVSAIYPEVKFLPGSHGVIKCTDEETLCIVDWADVNRLKMCWLTGLAYIEEIRGSHLE